MLSFIRRSWRRLWRHVDGLAPVEERILLGAASLLGDEDRRRFLDQVEAIIHVRRGQIEDEIKFELRAIDVQLLPLSTRADGAIHLASIEIGFEGKVVPADVWLSNGLLDKLVIRPWVARSPTPDVFEIVSARKVGQ